MYKNYTQVFGLPFGYVRKMLLIMKLAAIILISTLVQVSASSFGQRLTLTQKNVSIEKVLMEIKIQTGYDMLVFTAKFNTGTKIDVDFKDAPIVQVMDKIVSGNDFTYSIEDKNVVIKEKSPTFLDRLAERWADRDVRGRVVDEKGNPLPNASIRVKGKDVVINSNDKGEFVIKGVADDAVLVISYVGFKQLEISLKDAVMPLELKLNVQTGELEEVNVNYSTGYQNIPKERATGSFTFLDKEILDRNPSTNILDRIQNVTNGLRYDFSGRAGVNYIIRGFSTINSNRNPLLVVDGFPYEESVGKVFIASLNPNDVESITVLKDAAAASIWGARSGNGVIVITTKKGKSNAKPEVSFTSNLTLNEKPALSDYSIMSSADAIYYEKELFKTGYYEYYDTFYPLFNLFPAVSPAIETLLSGQRGELSDLQVDSTLARYAQHNILDDISKHLLQKGLFQQYNVSVRGGDSRSTYYASIGYDRNRAVEVGKQNDRFTANLASTYRLNKIVEVGAFFNYGQNTGINSALNYLTLIPGSSNMVAPYSNLKDVQGNPAVIPHPSSGVRKPYIDTLKAPGIVDWRYRPLDELNSGRLSVKDANTRIGGDIKFNLMKGFNFLVKGQYNRILSTSRNELDVESYSIRDRINRFVFTDATGKTHYPFPVGGNITISNGDLTAWNVRGQLDFNETWGEHMISALGGWEMSESRFFQNTTDLLGYDKGTGAFVSTIDYQTPYDMRPQGRSLIGNAARTDGSLNRFRSFFGNLSYTFRGRYTITSSTRVDETNLIGLDASLKRVPLWSVGGLWNVVNEGFLPSSVDRLSFRATYGWNGNINSSVSTLPIISYTTNNTSIYAGFPYANLSSPPNPSLTWEKVATVNVGMDYGFFGNRIFGSVEWYRKNGRDLIGPIQTDPTRGVMSYQGNYASIISKGWDIALNAIFAKKGDLEAMASLNFSYNTDKVTDYAPATATVRNNPLYYVGGRAVLTKGEPLFQMYAYKWAGLDPKTGAPRGYLADTIASYNLVMNSTTTDMSAIEKIGSSVPKYFGNFLGSFRKGDLSISFNLTYQLGYYFLTKPVRYSTLQQFGASNAEFSQRWQKPGDEAVTNVPSMVLTYDPERDNFYTFSSAKVERGDHIRLQDVRLSYTLSSLLRSFKTKLAITGNVSNLGVIWKATKQDVDPASIGLPRQPRTYTLGITANF